MLPDPDHDPIVPNAAVNVSMPSDLPGRVIAQVTTNVYDTVTGQYLLIPQGSRLIGAYDSVIAFGQERALVVWQRIIMPDGSSVVNRHPARHGRRRLCRARRPGRLPYLAAAEGHRAIDAALRRDRVHLRRRRERSR